MTPKRIRLGAAPSFLTIVLISIICQTVSPLSVSAKPSSEEKAEEQEAPSTDHGTQASNAPCISWTNPQIKPRVLLLCIHGLGLYSGSYKDFGSHMAELGVATYAIDVRGFGSWMKSGGKEEVDFNGCLDDIATAIKSIRAANPNLPLFLLGESMGGAIALRYASEHPETIDGLISSVPSGSRFQQKKTDLKVAIDFLRGPNKQRDIGKSVVKQATDNSKLKRDWENDPLDRMNLSAKDLIRFQKFMNENHDAAKKVTKLPVLFVQGMEDKLVKPEGTWDLFNELVTADKFFVALPSEHLIFEETQDDPVDRKIKNFRLLVDWLFAEAKASLSLRDLTDQATLMDAISMMFTNNLEGARAVLQTLTTARPRNTLAHYFLGQAYLKTKQLALAKAEFSKAVSLAGGTQLATQANNYLVNLANDPSSDVTPTIEPAPEIAQGKPTVLAFYANWADQCDQLDDWFAKGRTQFNTQVQFQKIDVDQESNKALVTQFKIGPIPTIVFLAQDGRFDSALIGETSFTNISDAVSRLLKAKPVKR